MVPKILPGGLGIKIYDRWRRIIASFEEHVVDKISGLDQSIKRSNDNKVNSIKLSQNFVIS